MTRNRALPRSLHPYAWWLWAILLAVSASLTTNPLLLASIIAAASVVTFARRGDNPWAKGFVVYLALGAFVVAFRVLFRVLFGGGDGPTVLFRLPEIELPWWVGGIRLLGAVSAESLLTGFYDGMQLAAIIICLGAANSLANPKRLLAALPGALYEIGTVLVVAVGIFPQLGDSLLRVRRARALRAQRSDGSSRRRRYRLVQGIVVPVLTDALERSQRLAASMDVRGYGRHGTATHQERRLTTALGLVSLAAAGVATYFYLSLSAPGPQVGGVPVTPVLLLGLSAGAGLWSMRRAGSAVRRTRYRADSWEASEWLVVGAGAGLLASLVLTDVTSAGLLAPDIRPFEWPELSASLAMGLLAAALPAVATPRPAAAARPAAWQGV